jgi:hypothetical protein
VSERRFDTEHDTPCPFRLARFGYRRTGEFRSPRNGELYIQPTEGPSLQEHEPVVLGACQDHKGGEPRHIVEAITEEQQAAMSNPAVMLISALTGMDPLEITEQMGQEEGQ